MMQIRRNLLKVPRSARLAPVAVGSGACRRAQRQGLLVNRAAFRWAGAIIAQSTYVIGRFRARRQRPQKNFCQPVELTTLAFAESIDDFAERDAAAILE